MNTPTPSPPGYRVYGEGLKELIITVGVLVMALGAIICATIALLHGAFDATTWITVVTMALGAGTVGGGVGVGARVYSKATAGRGLVVATEERHAESKAHSAWWIGILLGVIAYFVAACGGRHLPESPPPISGHIPSAELTSSYDAATATIETHVTIPIEGCLWLWCGRIEAQGGGVVPLEHGRAAGSGCVLVHELGQQVFEPPIRIGECSLEEVEHGVDHE